MKSKIIFMTFMMFIVFCVHKSTVSAKASPDLFEGISNLTSAEFVEWGERASFISNEGSEGNGAEDTFLDVLGIDTAEFLINKTGEGKFHYTAFESQNKSGFITLNDKKTTIEVIEKSNKYELKRLEHSMLKIIESNKYQIYRYAKIKTKNQNVETIKNDIITFLKNNKSENINVTPLEQGYSITALTGCYEAISSGNEKIDFNVAICSYDSGTYVIMGTPLIMKDY